MTLTLDREIDAISHQAGIPGLQVITAGTLPPNPSDWLARPEMRMLLTSGFCGGYTTFSTFSYDTAQMLGDGEYGRAAAYVGASVGVSLIGVFAGFAAANWWLAVRRAA